MYYVYVGYFNNQIVYVGKGKANRDAHLNSGCSHVYQANKIHFSGQTIEVRRIVENLSEEDALDLENLVIYEASPLWNSKVRCLRNKFKRKNSSSKYLGVASATSKIKPWRAFCKIPGKTNRFHIGNFTTEEEAALARDTYLIENQIPGKLNFEVI